MFSKRTSFSRANISKDFLAAAKAFAGGPLKQNGDSLTAIEGARENDNSDNSNAENAVSGHTPSRRNPLSAQKSASRKPRSAVKSGMFPLVIPVEQPSASPTGMEPPPVPSKLRLIDEDDVQSSARKKRARTSDSASTADSQDGTPIMRHASSSGSESGNLSNNNGGSMASRLAKTDVRYVEMKRKLMETQTLLANTTKRAEDAEREIERLKGENRELRRKLEAQQQQQPSTLRHHSSSNEDPGVVFTLKLENVDKSLTSKALLQMAESFGGEVTTARIMKSPSGVLNAYCSFSEEKDAQKAMEQFRKQGMTVNLLNNNSSNSSDPTSFSASKRAASSSASAPSSASKKSGRWGLGRS